MYTNIHFLQTFFEATPLGMAHLEIIHTGPDQTTDYRFGEINPSFEKMLGQKKANFTGKLISQLFQEDENSKNGWRSLFKKIAAENGTSEFEHFIARTGRWFRVNAWQSDDRNIILVLSDITEIKNKEEELRIFLESVENSSDAVGISTPEGKHYYQNHAFDELFGDIGENPAETVYVDPAAGHEIFRVIMSGGQWSGEVMMYAKDRRILTILLRAYASKDKAGNITALVGVHTDITGRKNAEDALRFSENRFRGVFEKSEVAKSITRIDGRMLQVNKAFADLIGYSIDEMQHLNFAEITCPDDLAISKEAIRSLLAGEKTICRFEKRYVHRSGKLIWTDISTTLVYDDDGNPLYLIASIVDITERKQAEYDLIKSKATAEENEALFRAIFEQAAVGVAQIESKTGRFLRINQAYCSITGFTEREMLNIDFQSITHPDDLQADLDNMNLLIKGEIRSFSMEKRYTRKSGEMVWVELTVSPMWNPGEEPGTHIAVVQDITTRKLTETALLESTQKFRHVAENITDGIWLMDLGFNTIWISSSVTRLRGYSLEEIQLLPVESQLIPESALLLSGGIAETCTPENLADPSVMNLGTLELGFWCKDGSVLWTDCTYTIIREADGRPQAILGVGHDITDRKKAEEAKKLNEKRLEALVTLNNMTGANERELTHFAMEAAVSLTNSMIGYIAFMNEDETVLTMYAWSEQAMKECAIIDKPLVYPVDTTGLWGEAVRQRRAIITNNYAAPGPWKKGTPTGHVNIIRHMNAPIFEGDRIVCVAGVGNKNTDYGEDDVRQLTLLISGLWSIIRRKQAESGLAESEFKYKSLVESSQDAIFVVDKNGYYQFVNNAFASTLGHTHEYFAGKSFWDIYPKDLADMRYEGVVKVFETGLPSEVEVKVPLPDRTLYYLAKTNPVRDAQGNVFQVLVTATDITERKRAEEKLAESEKRYEQIDSSSRDSIYAYDRQGRFVHANRALCRLLGRSRGEIIGKTHAELGFPQAQCEEWQALHDEVYATGDTVIRETATPIQDGAVMYFEVILNPIAEPGGAIIGISGITRDITERKQAEETLRERESLLRKIAENYPNSYLSIIEKDFTIGFTSGQEFKNQHLDPEQFIGLTLEQVFGDQADLVREEYIKTFRGEERIFELFINNQY